MASTTNGKGQLIVYEAASKITRRDSTSSINYRKRETSSAVCGRIVMKTGFLDRLENGACFDFPCRLNRHTFEISYTIS